MSNQFLEQMSHREVRAGSIADNRRQVLNIGQPEF